MSSNVNRTGRTHQQENRRAAAVIVLTILGVLAAFLFFRLIGYLPTPTIGA